MFKIDFLSWRAAKSSAQVLFLPAFFPRLFLSLLRNPSVILRLSLSFVDLLTLLFHLSRSSSSFSCYTFFFFILLLVVDCGRDFALRASAIISIFFFSCIVESDFAFMRVSKWLQRSVSFRLSSFLFFSVYLSILLTAYLFNYRHICLSIYLSSCLPDYLVNYIYVSSFSHSFYLPHPSVCLLIYLSVCISIYLSFYLSIYLSVSTSLHNTCSSRFVAISSSSLPFLRPAFCRYFPPFASLPLPY